VRSELVGAIVNDTGSSERKVCKVLSWPRTSVRYRRKRGTDAAARAALKALSAEHPRYGYRRAHAMLRRTPLRLARKTVQRLWREEKLQVPRRRKLKPVTHIVRTPMEAPSRPNQGWALDFTHEQLKTGENFRILTIIDEFTREIIFTRAAFAFKAATVRQCLRAMFRERGTTPAWLRSDNGSEFVANQSSKFLLDKGIDHARSRPGTPTDNAKIESFHSRFRDELLDRTLFNSIAHANEELAKYQTLFNNVRPHSSLRYFSPAEFRSRHTTN
jgi:putative transposase